MVDNLDVDLLAGTPFMITNDISARTSRQQITVKGSHVTYYGTTLPDPTENYVRRTQAEVLRAPSSPTVVWTGEYLEMEISEEIGPDFTL